MMCGTIIATFLFPLCEILHSRIIVKPLDIILKRPPPECRVIFERRLTVNYLQRIEN